MQRPTVNAQEGKDCEVAALALKVGIEETSLRPEPLIIHRIALGELEAAIGMVEYGAERPSKIILNYNRGTATYEQTWTDWNLDLPIRGLLRR